MAFTPRGEEVAAVVELLESPEFDSSYDMASAIVKRLSWVLSMRDGHAVVSGNRLLFAPYYDEAEATKVAALVGDGKVVTAWSPGTVLAKYDSTTGVKWTGFCTCSHPKAMHLSEGSSRGKCGYTYSDECECRKFDEAVPKKAARPKKVAPPKAA